MGGHGGAGMGSPGATLGGVERWTELLADWPVVVGQDAERGRFVKAARRIGKGDTVLRAVPFAAAQLGSHLKRVCGGCMQARRGGRLELHCPGCAQVFYCSRECLEAHARGSRAGEGGPVRRPPHRLTCAPLKMFASGNLDAELESVLRLVVEVAALAHLEKAPHEISNEGEGHERQGARGSGGAQMGPEEEEATFKDFLLLQSHHENMDAMQRKVLRKPIALLRKALGSGHWPGFEVPTEEELLSWVSRVDSNCFGMWASRPPKGEGEGPKAPECIGREVYVAASLFNHACSPNCEIDAGHGWLEVVALQDVEQGAELSISYIDGGRPVSSRRKYLQKFYKFDCKCPLCLEESQGGAQKKYSYERSHSTPKKGKKGHAKKGPKKKGQSGSDGPAADGALSEKCIDDAFQKLMFS